MHPHAHRTHGASGTGRSSELIGSDDNHQRLLTGYLSAGISCTVVCQSIIAPVSVLIMIGIAGQADQKELKELADQANWACHAPPPWQATAPAPVTGLAAADLEVFREQLFTEQGWEVKEGRGLPLERRGEAFG